MKKYYLIKILVILFLSTNVSSNDRAYAKSEEGLKEGGNEISIANWQEINPLPDEYSVAKEFHGIAITIDLVCHQAAGCKVSIRDFGLAYETDDLVLPYGSTEPFIDRSFAGLVYGSQTDFPDHINFGDRAQAHAIYSVGNASVYALVHDNVDVDIILIEK